MPGAFHLCTSFGNHTVKSLYPQKIIMPPSRINHIFDGSKKAQIVTAPIMSNIRPNNSTSPFLHFGFFFSIQKHTFPIMGSSAIKRYKGGT